MVATWQIQKIIADIRTFYTLDIIKQFTIHAKTDQESMTSMVIYLRVVLIVSANEGIKEEIATNSIREHCTSCKTFIIHT